jgi:hypothetical protein
MSRAVLLTTAVAVMMACLVHAQNPANLHDACYTGSDGVFWEASSDDSGTKFSRTVNGQTTTKSMTAVPQVPAPGQPWTQGVRMANTLVHDHFFPSTKKIVSATWTHNDYYRTDVLNFTNKDGVSYVFSTSSCPNANNCPAYGGSQGPHCFTQYETCCGQGSMSPKCMSNSNGDHCCGWYLSSTTCNSTQSCCGMLGPGASSYAFCCGPETTCCTARIGYDGTSSCCPAGTTCCQAASVGICCAADEVCNPNGNSCVKATPSP